MNAGRELDALVAAKVMGFTPVEWSGNTLVYGDQETGDVVPAYSTRIAGAWRVVERVAEMHDEWGGKLDFRLRRDSATKWHCDIGHACVNSTSAPLAICLAALEAIGVVVPA